MNQPQQQQKEEKDDDDDCCPICLREFDTLEEGNRVVRDLCGHRFCQSCIERHLLTQRPTSSNSASSSATTTTTTQDNDDNNVVMMVTAPTLGHCPISRQEQSLFDLVYDDATDQPAYPPNTDPHTWSIQNTVYRERYSNGNHNRNGNNNNSWTFHFDATQPHVEWQGLLVQGNTTTEQDDNDNLPNHHLYYFEPGCHYHEKSNTFHGTIRFDNNHNNGATNPTFCGMTSVSWLLQFSSDQRYIASGVVTQHLVNNNNDSNNNEFPLDGRWKVVWNNDVGSTVEIRVRGNQFQHGRDLYVLHVKDNPVWFAWPSHYHHHNNNNSNNRRQPVVQRVASGFHHDDESTTIPQVGDTIEWSLSSPANEITNITWTRITVEQPPPKLVNLLGPQSGTVYERVRTGSPCTQQPTYHAGGLWGNTFCQLCMVGLASYHFEEDESYISYEHPLCGQWPRLDDGSPIPSRVLFRETTFDPTDRVFRGSICWQEDYQTTWQGCRKWIYSIKFDQHYTFCIGGTVRSVTQHSDELQEMSIFGLDLLYANAAIEDFFRQQLQEQLEEEEEEQQQQQQQQDGQEQPESGQPTASSFQTLSFNMRRYWREQGASVRTAAMLHKLYIFIIVKNDNPIDFNL